MNKRQYKSGIERQQEYLLPPRVEEYVSQENPVRAIDSYVESLDLEQMGFVNAGGEITPGQPAYAPEGLLKLYLYGYLHRVRSSRRLEAECQRNLEVMWLLGGLRPGYKTIADFRKVNLKALKKVNQDFVRMCKELELFGGELVGIDGSFFRGNVGKDHIYTQERLERALGHIEKDITRYLKELEQVDQEEETKASPADPELATKLERLRKRQQKHNQQLQELKESGKTQIAEVDPDARRLSKPGQGTIAGYNVQTAVDDKHKLLVTCEVVQDGNDENQLAPMALAAKKVLGVETLETTQDLGYFNGQQIKTCIENGIIPYVPEPDRQGSFPRRQFQYDPVGNCYHCPAGKKLTYQGICQDSGRTYWRYRSSQVDCAQCPFKPQCLPGKTQYRILTRWEHEAILEAHRERMARDGAKKMRRRAELCEHPFGTIKLWCGWTHFLLRGLEKVRGEMNLLMLCYNFKRVLSILGLAGFQAYCSLRHNPSGC